MIECSVCGNRWTKEKYAELEPMDASLGWCPSCGENGNTRTMVEVSRALLEELRDFLSAPQRTPERMETHRAESEGVDYLLASVVEALGGE